MTEVTVDLITAHAQAGPDKIAIIDDRPGEEPRQVTFAELDRYTNRIANGLLALGVDPGDKAMWMGQNSLEVMAFGHAARKAGLISVPLNYRLTDEESVYVINNSDAVVIWADTEFAEMLNRISGEFKKVFDLV